LFGGFHCPWQARKELHPLLWIMLCGLAPLSRLSGLRPTSHQQFGRSDASEDRSCDKERGTHGFWFVESAVSNVNLVFFDIIGQAEIAQKAGYGELHVKRGEEHEVRQELVWRDQQLEKQHQMILG
jgi:hypothetical protein